MRGVQKAVKRIMRSSLARQAAEGAAKAAAGGGMSVVRSVRLRVPAGAAKPGPAIGQALGPLGINMMEFCKAFNDSTIKLVKETPMPVKLTAYSNRTFSFVVKSPPTSWFLKNAAGIQKVSKVTDPPRREGCGEEGTWEFAWCKVTEPPREFAWWGWCVCVCVWECVCGPAEKTSPLNRKFLP